MKRPVLNILTDAQMTKMAGYIPALKYNYNPKKSLIFLTVFVVDTSGKILFEYINPDFRTRLSAGLLIAVLRELKNNDS